MRLLSMKPIVSSMILSMGLVLGSAVVRAEGPTSETKPSDQPSAIYALYLQATQSVSDFDRLPLQMAQKHLHAPLVVGAEMLMPIGNAKLFGDVHAAMLGYTAAPAFGIALGPVLKVGVAEVRITGEVESNGSLDTDVQSSQLEAWRFALNGVASVERGIWQPSLGLRLISMTTVQISEMENLPTKIAHAGTYELRPAVRVKLPPCLVEAALSVYSFGKTSITSKEFTHIIERQMVFRPMLGAGLDLRSVELWLRGFAVIPYRGDDSVEYLYMAPLYVNENMMTKNALTLEARFRL